MDKRRRAGVIAASGGAISASTAGLAAGHHGSFAGLDSDFWMGCVLGIAIGLVVLALITVARGGSICRLP
jgi:hypothetical protein